MEKSRLLSGEWESGNGGLKCLQEVPSLPPSLLSSMQPRSLLADIRALQLPRCTAAVPSVKIVVCFFQYLAVKPS